LLAGRPKWLKVLKSGGHMNWANRSFGAHAAFVASPALAAIDSSPTTRHPHITNNSKEKARLEERDGTSAPQLRRLKTCCGAASRKRSSPKLRLNRPLKPH
jgi:hypothetical protein